MKKIITLCLAALTILTATMAAFASAGSAARIIGMADSLSLGYSGDTDLGEVYPSDSRVETVELLDTMFTWDGHTPDPATPTRLTAAQIRDAKLDVRTVGSSGKAVKDVRLNQRDAVIELSFVEELVGTKEQGFSVELVLSVDGSRQPDYSITFTGTLKNPVIEIYAGETQVDISDGSVIEAMEYNSSVEVELGNGVSLKTRLFKGKMYYGTASIEPVENGEMTDHQEISEILTLRTVGFSNSDTVRLDGRYSGTYIYDKNLELLGKGACEVPLRSVYYLSDKELDVEKEESTDVSKPADLEQNQPPAQPADQTPSNVNHNPGTGNA